MQLEKVQIDKLKIDDFVILNNNVCRVLKIFKEEERATIQRLNDNVFFCPFVSYLFFTKGYKG